MYVHCGITKVKGDGFYPIPHIMFNDSMISSTPSTSTGRGPPSNARVSPRAIVSAALSPRVLIAVLHKQSWFASAGSCRARLLPTRSPYILIVLERVIEAAVMLPYGLSRTVFH